jgi:uncharacterized protein YyaL (SSP411 family)
MFMNLTTRSRTFACSLMLSLLAGGCLQGGESPKDLPPFKEWGAQALKTIQDDLWIPRSQLYAERRSFERRGREERRPAPAFMWGVGVQLSALAAAAKVEPETYLKQARSYADAIEVYWLESGGISGYDVQPGPKQSDRYYDDNAWLVLALAEVFELTGDRKYLEKSAETFKFVMSGQDDKLGGGLYWRETPRESKNTCTNAPAIVSALRLYQLTEKKEYLETATSINEWTRKHLQDEDGLYWDNIKLDGTLDRRKFSYNSALMLRANCLFHEITGEEAYLKEAKRIADAAAGQWVRESGGIADGGRFAHLLLEAFIALHERDADPRWLKITRDALVFVQANVRDANGRHASRWDRKSDEPLRQIMLLDLASAARAYWVAADVFKAEVPASGNFPE